MSANERQVEHARWMREHGFEPGARPEPPATAGLAAKKAHVDTLTDRLEAAERYAASQHGPDLRHADRRVERLQQQITTLTSDIWAVEEALTGPSCPDCGNPYPTVDYGRARCSCQDTRRF